MTAVTLRRERRAPEAKLICSWAGPIEGECNEQVRLFKE